jgi:hypothetical protein
MFQRSVTNWVLLVGCFVTFAASDVALGQYYTWPGEPGYGGLYGGYGGYRGYETGYPANAYGSRRSYGYSNPNQSSPVSGEIGGVIYYSPPASATIRQPYPFRNRQPDFSSRTYDGTTPSRIYTGSSPVATTPAPTLSTPQAATDNGEIVIFSPPTNTIDVQYSLNGVSYTMKPGSMQKFANDRIWIVNFNVGNSQNVKYTLATGRYKFKQSEAGIGLFMTQQSPEAPAPVPEPDSSATPANDSSAPVPMPVE